MTFSNPIFDELLVGDLDGQYVLIDFASGVPKITLSTGDPAETVPGDIATDGVALRITPPTAFGERRLELDATQLVIGSPILGLDLLDPPGGAWGSTAAQAITTTTTTTITNYSTVIGSSPVDVGVSSGVFTPTRAGRWRFGIQGRFAANVTGIRIGYAQGVSGVDEEAWTELPSGTQPSVMSAWWEDDFDGVFDNFRWRVFQNSGGNLNWRTQRAYAEYHGKVQNSS